MEFKNRENNCYKVNGKLVWESRSVAVNCVIAVWKNGKPYVLVSERGPKAADYHGKMNLIAGYLDWDESGVEAVYRETWEEVGLNIPEFVLNHVFHTYNWDMKQPWHVQSDPDENRQNVSLRFGCSLGISGELPELTTEHNEIEGEVVNPMWLPVNKLGDYEWAFNHDNVIREYFRKIGHFGEL